MNEDLGHSREIIPYQESIIIKNREIALIPKKIINNTMIAGKIMPIYEGYSTLKCGRKAYTSALSKYKLATTRIIVRHRISVRDQMSCLAKVCQTGFKQLMMHSCYTSENSHAEPNSQWEGVL